MPHSKVFTHVLASAHFLTVTIAHLLPSPSPLLLFPSRGPPAASSAPLPGRRASSPRGSLLRRRRGGGGAAAAHTKWPSPNCQVAARQGSRAARPQSLLSFRRGRTCARARGDPATRRLSAQHHGETECDSTLGPAGSRLSGGGALPRGAAGCGDVPASRWVRAADAEADAGSGRTSVTDGRITVRVARGWTAGRKMAGLPGRGRGRERPGEVLPPLPGWSNDRG